MKRPSNNKVQGNISSNNRSNALDFSKFIVLVLVASVFGVIGKNTAKYFLPSFNSKNTIKKHMEEFVSGCSASGGTEEECKCIFTQIIDKYGLEKFKENNHIWSTSGREAVDQEYVQSALEDFPKLCKERHSNQSTERDNHNNLGQDYTGSYQNQKN